MKTISRIAYSNDKKNKTRSILIMMSICLTTMLLVIISTVGNGMIRLQKSQAAGSYGSNYGLFVAADASQLKEVSRRAEIDATGTMCTEGIIKGNEKGGFVCMDDPEPPAADPLPRLAYNRSPLPQSQHPIPCCRRMPLNYPIP